MSYPNFEEWEVFESCNRTLVVTKAQKRLVASCINKDEAESICNTHNCLETKSEANQTNEVKCSFCGKKVKDHLIICNACNFEIAKSHVQEIMANETNLIFIRNRLMNLVDIINEEYYAKHGQVSK